MQMSTLSKVNESGDSVHKLTTFEREGKKKKKSVALGKSSLIL